MRNDKIDIATRRKSLYRRQRRKKSIARLSCLLLLVIPIMLIIKFTILNKSISVTSSPDSNQSVTNTVNEDPFTVCIDAGHGDWDNGTLGIDGSNEKDITLNVALKLGRLIEKNGMKVIYTRTNDLVLGTKVANDSLKERIKIAEIFQCDLFISIHCNSDSNSNDTKGVECWYTPDDSSSLELATIIEDELSNIGYTPSRGLKTYSSSEDALAVLEKNAATSVLIELGFLSNRYDANYLSSTSGQTECAKYINKAIIRYKENLSEN